LKSHNFVIFQDN